MPPVDLQFLLLPKPNSGENPARPIPQDDLHVYRIEVRAAHHRNRQARQANQATSFQFVLGGGSGGDSFRYYRRTDPRPAQADCFVQLWELDKFVPDLNRRMFDEWYRQEDEDGGDPATARNTLIATFPGYVAQTRAGGFEFICTDDSQLPLASGNQPYLTVEYRKIGVATSGPDLGYVQARIRLSDDFESRWEFGLYPTISSTENRWGDSAYSYPIFFVTSLGNLIRKQLREGGLTVACYSALNNTNADDDLTTEKYRWYIDQLNQRIDAGQRQSNEFLNSLRPRAQEIRRERRLPALSETEERTHWNAVDEEIQWQTARLKSDLKITEAYRSRDAWRTAYLRWIGSRRRGAFPPRLVPKNMDYTFDAWRRAACDTSAAAHQDTSQSNLLSFFQTRYGLAGVELVTPVQRGTANVAQRLNVAMVGTVSRFDFEDGEPDDHRNIRISAKKIKDIFNDREFPSNSQQLSQEFGFLALGSENQITRGAHPLAGYLEIPSYLTDICSAVKARYPELFPGETQPRIYRFVIFTHGSRIYGLKFPPSNWFTAGVLTSPEGQGFLDAFAPHFVPRAVVTLYACSTGASASVHERLASLRASEKARIRREVQGAARREQIAAVDRRFRALEQEYQRMSSHQKRLIGYGGPATSSAGNPTSASEIGNAFGIDSFAQRLRDQLRRRGVQADVWSHTDAGHTSRNSRLRLFTGSGQTHDLIRLVFQAGDPTDSQVDWWWPRGDGSVPMEHQHAIKKAALCSYDSVNDSAKPFSLKKVLDDLRGWGPA